MLADALAGGPALAVCADVPRRIGGLGARAGGFALASYHGLERRPELALASLSSWRSIPRRAAPPRLCCDAGSGFTHLAWGQDELRFTQQMHELEYGLRASLAALYRGLGIGEGWPARSSSACSAEMVRMAARHV